MTSKIQVGVLKLHNSGTIVNTTTTSSGSQTQSNNGSTKIEIQTTQSAAQTIANAQVCLDPMTISDVDVRTNQIHITTLIIEFKLI